MKPRRWLVLLIRRARDILNLLLVILCLNLLAQNLGPLSIEWSKMFALVCLGAFLALNLRLPLQNLRKGLAFGGLACYGLAIAALVFAQQPVLLLAVSSVVLGCTAMLLRSLGSRFQHGSVYAMTAWLYAVVEMVRAGIPQVQELNDGICAAWSGLAGRTVVRQPLVIGPSGLGEGILATLLCFLTVRVLRAYTQPGFSIKPTVWVLAGLVALNGIFLWLQNQKSVLPQYPLALFYSQVSFLGAGVLLAGILNLRTRSAARHSPNYLAWSVACVGLLGGVAALTTWPVHYDPRAKTVLFRDDGLLDWIRPTFEKFGPLEQGMFGSLPDYLKAGGYQCRFSPQTSSEELKSADVLVIINPTNQWTRTELNSIWSFVERGGALLVLGDHTDIMGSRDVLNTLLRPVRIGFNFDAAMPAKGEWKDCLRFCPHPATFQLSRAAQTYIRIGASLDIASPAFPLIEGRYGFSDLGNILNVQGAYLGDYRYEKGERLGDMVLVAAAHHGRGKVMVFGDTTPFQNGALALSYEPLVCPAFEWLTSSDTGQRQGTRMLGALALVVSAGWLITLTTETALLWPLALFAAGFWAICAFNVHQKPELKLNGPLALIDQSHANRISLAREETASVDALTIALLRSGYLPLMIERWSPERLRAARLFVTTAPAKEFAEAELLALREFVQGGGVALVNCGWEEKGPAMQGLLDAFSMDILRIPLGPYPVNREENHLASQAQFINAWPVVVNGAELQASFDQARETYRPPVLDAARSRQLQRLLSPLLSASGSSSDDIRPGPATAPTNSVQVLFQTIEGYPVAIARRIGEGSVVLVGDTFYLGSENLENMRYYRRGNLLFLRHLFESAPQKKH